MPIFAPTITADMAKLVDVPDLGSGAARRVGSSPIIRTKKKLLKIFQKLFCFYIYFCTSFIPNNFCKFFKVSGPPICLTDSFSIAIN